MLIIEVFLFFFKSLYHSRLFIFIPVTSSRYLLSVIRNPFTVHRPSHLTASKVLTHGLRFWLLAPCCWLLAVSPCGDDFYKESAERIPL